MRRLEPEIRLNTFGHMGDGNIHYLVMRPLGAGGAATDAAAWKRRGAELVLALNDLVAEMGGSFSAEHGIGALKRDELRRYAEPSRLTLMQIGRASCRERVGQSV